MTKIKAIAGIVLLISAFALVAPAMAQSNNVISIGDVQAAPDANITTPILINNSVNISGIKINLSYNPAIVNVTNASFGDFNDSPPSDIDLSNSTNGYVKIYVVKWAGLSGNKTVANVELTAVGSACDTTDLNISILSLKDDAGGEVTDRSTENGTFTILDTTPPYTSGHDPAPGATNVPVDTNIVVHVKDDCAGVNQSTIVMIVEGAEVTPVVTGTTADYTLTYDPAADFDHEQVVNITIDASDLNTTPNVMPQVAYSFTAKAESVPTPVPGLSGIGLIAEVGILAVVLAISASATRKRRK